MKVVLVGFWVRKESMRFKFWVRSSRVRGFEYVLTGGYLSNWGFSTQLKSPARIAGWCRGMRGYKFSKNL